jgi:gliding motility-associated-like protein
LINLSAYSGKTIIVDFTRTNCGYGGHSGYAYIDVGCGVNAIKTNYSYCDSTTSLSAPPGFQTYTWMDASLSTVLDTGQTIIISTPHKTTAIKLILTPYKGFGCIDTLTKTINVLEVEAKDTTLCTGQLLTLNPTVLNGIAPLSYTWSPSSGLSCTNCKKPSLITSSSIKYIVHVTDSTGCSASDTADVKLYPQPKIKADDNTICFGEYAAITASGALKYFWTPSTGLFCDTCATPAFNPTVTTTYTVRGTDTNGCVDSTLVKITVNNPLQITVDSAGPVCAGTKVLLRARGSLSYSWSPAASLSCTTCDSTISSALVSTKYMVIGTDSNLCKDTAYLNLKIHPLPLIKTNGNAEVCEGSSLRMYVSGALKYIWSPAIELSCSICDSPIVTPKNNTLYTVIGTDLNGCVDSGKLQISVFNRKPVSVSSNDSICKGEKIQLFARGGTHYQWIPSTGLNSDTLASPTASPDKTIAYTVIVKQGICFVDTVNVGIFVQEPPNVAIAGDSFVNYGAIAHLYASGSNIEIYKWAQANELNCTDCPNPTATMTQTKTFNLIVTGPLSCKSEAEFTVRVFDCREDNIFIPNTFTPNGDGLNDTFYPIGQGVKLVKDFYIYSRWGEVVYEAHDFALNDPKIGWDGSYKGEKTMGDVFMYFINAICEKGNYLKLKGDISLVK